MSIAQLVNETLISNPMQFVLPPELEATAPPEARGLRRDDVRLMVSHYNDDHILHTSFRSLLDHLRRGDVLVINTSGTLKAALPASRADGSSVWLHLSTQLADGLWVVELRSEHLGKMSPFFGAHAGETISLPAEAKLRLLHPYQTHLVGKLIRLWVAELDLQGRALHSYLDQYGSPIRYNYVKARYPIDYYQTTYATEMGSAEMPSAGRAFTPELITRLVANGVQIAPLLLHTGVASLEAGEPPYAEYFRVSPETAALVNAARQEGRRVIAVGTTSIRALESVATPDGHVEAGSGWTELVITPERGISAVDGMLTGLHEPQATHLAMLQTLAGERHIALTYQSALDQRYLWHEFGDLHLILP